MRNRTNTVKYRCNNRYFHILTIKTKLNQYGKSRLYNNLDDEMRKVLYDSVHEFLQKDILENLLKQINDQFYEYMKK